MPTPGPRTQDHVIPGYNNPGREPSHRWNMWKRPGPVAMSGRSPGTMETEKRGHILAAGQVRQLWRQTVDYIGAQAPYSWTRNAPAPGRGMNLPGGFQITRALRYMTRSLYVAGGTDNTRLNNLHTKVDKRHTHKPVSVGAGGVRNRPTVRNRMTSFGSRVTPLNGPNPGASKE